LFLIAVVVLRSSLNWEKLREWLLEINWTSESKAEWQKFYDDAARLVISGSGDNTTFEIIPGLPKYEDLKPPECKRGIPNSAAHQNAFVFLTIVSLLTKIMTIVL
jgi:hypothetical protein